MKFNYDEEMFPCKSYQIDGEIDGLIQWLSINQYYCDLLGESFTIQSIEFPLRWKNGNSDGNEEKLKMNEDEEIFIFHVDEIRQQIIEIDDERFLIVSNHLRCNNIELLSYFFPMKFLP